MSVTVRIPTPLRKLTDGQAEVTVDGKNVREVLDRLDGQYAGVREKVFNETGEVRRFINLFLNGDDVRHLQGPETEVKPGDELSIVPAIAGGRDCR